MLIVLFIEHFLYKFTSDETLFVLAFFCATESREPKSIVSFLHAFCVIVLLMENYTIRTPHTI